MQISRQIKQKRSVEHVLKDLGLRREDSEKRLLRQLLESNGDFEDNRDTPQHNLLMQVEDIQGRTTFRVENFVEHDVDDKIVMLDQVYQESQPEFERLCALGMRYKKEQEMQRNNPNAFLGNAK